MSLSIWQLLMGLIVLIVTFGQRGLAALMVILLLLAGFSFYAGRAIVAVPMPETTVVPQSFQPVPNPAPRQGGPADLPMI